MGFFNTTVATLAAGKSVVAAILTDHDFNAGHSYNWTGYGDLDLDGVIWVGKGDLVAFTPLPFTGNDGASPLTITLSGVKAEFIAEARTLPTVRGRSQRIYLQMFAVATLQPIDAKMLLADRYMDVMTWHGTGPGTRSVAITSEDVWTDRDTAEFAMFSDADQQSLFPGDLGLEFVAEMVPGLRLKWPDFS